MAEGKKNRKQLSNKNTSIERETVLEISIRKQDSTARASRRIGAISINMDATRMSRKVSREMGT